MANLKHDSMKEQHNEIQAHSRNCFILNRNTFEIRHKNTIQKHVPVSTFSKDNNGKYFEHNPERKLRKYFEAKVTTTNDKIKYLVSNICKCHDAKCSRTFRKKLTKLIYSRKTLQGIVGTSNTTSNAPSVLKIPTGRISIEGLQTADCASWFLWIILRCATMLSFRVNSFRQMGHGNTFTSFLWDVT